MKKMFRLILVATTMLFFNSNYAQEKPQGPPTMGGKTHGEGFSAEKMTEKQTARLVKILKLTPAQVTLLTPILKAQGDKMKDLMADRGQKREQFKNIMDDGAKQINAILTPEQQVKFAKMQEEMKKRMEDRRGKRDAKMMEGAQP